MSRALEREKHVAFVKKLGESTESLESALTEHLRLNGLYWGLTAVDLMGERDALSPDAVISYVESCWNPDGGFGAHPGHDSHMLSTVSAVQILVTLDRLTAEHSRRASAFISGLQTGDGSFMGDKYGEIDTRFLYGAFNALSLMGRLDVVDVSAAVEFVSRCRNMDGGFGHVPGAESHAAHVLTCTGALAIAKRLDLIDADLLGWWLCERQLPCGGFNGRPQKLEDVCYSWWVLASLALIKREHWIDKEALIGFILRAQDEDGGMSDRPGNVADVFHTVFGIAGLSILGFEGLKKVDPAYCLASDVTARAIGRVD